MIPMRITPEEYAEYFPPAPDYLIVQRIPMKYDKIGSIEVPQVIQQGSRRFITVGKILAVSALVSDEDWVEYMKEVLRSSKYVGFSSHVTAEAAILPHFEVDKDVSIIMLHVKDTLQIPKNLDDLLDRQFKWEAEEEQRNAQAMQSLQEERAKLVAGSQHA
ncbi:MAG TPA: hypothetical protein VFW62_02655 [bacterium]|nr:hypothetical protein [bacterium]